ncbi:MAG: right-handed parallel beta-helix repeat-containing protein [Candidatus Hodarchaeales archaeon]|jgi:parallel beta-helix repeat protein
MREKIYLIIIILSLIFQSTSITLTFNPDDNSSENLAFKTVDNFVTHAPINIDGNSDFHLQANIKGWFGNGTASNPYILSNYNITGPNNDIPLIAIRYTTVHFTIKDSIISGASIGISLINVKNSLLFNVTISKTQRVGLHLRNSDHNTMNRIIILNYIGNGIELELSNNNTFINNTINAEMYGFQVVASSNNTLIKNTININSSVYPTGPSWSYSLYLRDSCNNSILNNIMTERGILIDLTEICSQIEIVNNTLNGKQIVYKQNISEEVIPEGAGQIILINCSFMLIKNQYFTKGGLIAGYSYNLTIRDNIAQDTGHGYYLYFSINNTLINNTARSNHLGYNLYKSSNIRLINNTANNNSGGMFLRDSNNNHIIDNTANNNHYGFLLMLSNFNYLIDNIANNNNHTPPSS